MLPSSHHLPTNAGAGQNCADAGELNEAFSAFISAAGRLEDSHRELNQQVTKLRAELAKSNAALKLSLARNKRMRSELQHILDSLPCGVVVLDDEETIKLINPEAKRILPQDEWDRSIRIGAQLPIQKLFPNSTGNEEADVCVNSGGEKRWLSLRTRAAQGSTSRGTNDCGTILIVRETTAQKQLEAERESARNSIALAELSSVLAHEIRNPLGCLELVSDLIAEQFTGDPEWIRHLRGGIRSLSATVNNVLRFHNPGVVNLVSLEPVPVIKNAVDFVRPAAEQKEIHLTYVNDCEGVWLEADPNALQQLLLNLLSNAIRHTGPKGRIDVTLRRKEVGSVRSAVLRVKDSGCGIAPELLPRVFEPGVSGTGNRPGLGLSVCRKIIEQHGATVSVTSEVNVGTTFQVEFPCSK